MITNDTLAAAYTRLAPLYDRLTGRLFASARRGSIDALALRPGERVLLVGVGTGQDLPCLPPGVDVTGLDLTPAMLALAGARAECLGIRADLRQGDALDLPFPDAAFDAVVLHLILAVVPDAARCFTEAVRVTRPGGRLAVLDKFLPLGETAGPLRVVFDRMLRPLGTGINTRFEDLLDGTPNVRVLEDTPALFRGAYRRVLVSRAR